ncbi:MAG: heavy-metal-associated domain-containing protein [Ignavibacteriae bacterium]|nr:heavy-metal-associated domain-containing protein [Ignavibacteriota bacterium]
MKTILFSFIAIITLLVVGCGTTEKQPMVQVASIKVESAVCGTCGNTITDALKKVDGVQEASVDIEKKIATVKYASDKADLPKLEKAISDAGYDANDTKANPEAYDKLDECCKIGETSHH